MADVLFYLNSGSGFRGAVFEYHSPGLVARGIPHWYVAPERIFCLLRCIATCPLWRQCDAERRPVKREKQTSWRDERYRDCNRRCNGLNGARSCPVHPTGTRCATSGTRN